MSNDLEHMSRENFLFEVSFKLRSIETSSLSFLVCRTYYSKSFLKVLSIKTLLSM